MHYVKQKDYNQDTQHLALILNSISVKIDTDDCIGNKVDKQTFIDSFSHTYTGLPTKKKGVCM